MWGAVSRVGSNVASRVASSPGLAGIAGGVGGSVFGDLSGISPADVLPFSEAGTNGTSGGGLLGGGSILWVFAGIAALAAVSNIAGE